MRRLRLPVPTTILTGTLGVGKTTAICSLVQRKPRDEHWCVIVNEFGAVGVDGVAIRSTAEASGGGVAVKQIAGGCMCCASMLLPAIAQIIRQEKPDRLLIEPSGLGHPAGLLDILQGPHLASAIQLNAIICLVDLVAFSPQQLAANLNAMDQVTLADILVGSKADAAAAGTIPAFHDWAQEALFPPKAQVLAMAQGEVPLDCLDATRSGAALLLRPNSSGSSSNSSSRARQQQQLRQHAAAAAAAATPHAAAAAQASPADDGSTPHIAEASAGQPKPRQPRRVENRGGSSSRQQQQQHVSCGWVFDASDQFQGQALLELLQLLQPAVARVKGVFRTGPKQWVMPVAAPAGATLAGGAAGAAHTSPAAASTAAPVEDSCGSGPGLGQPQAAALHAAPPCSAGSGAAAGATVLQLQPACYRGPSIVEVILQASAAQQQQQQLCQLLSGAAQQPAQTSPADGDDAGAGPAMPAPAPAPALVWDLLEQALLACLV